MAITTVKTIGTGWLVTYDTGDILSVPNDSDNRHYQEVQDWIAEPNTPDAEFTLQEVKDQRKVEVNSLRTDKTKTGFVFNTNTFDATVESRAGLAAYVANVNAGNGLPASFTWRSTANLDIPFTTTTILDLHDTMTDWLDAAFNNSWTHKANIDAESTISAVNAYDITTGWPT